MSVEPRKAQQFKVPTNVNVPLNALCLPDRDLLILSSGKHCPNPANKCACEFEPLNNYRTWCTAMG